MSRTLNFFQCLWERGQNLRRLGQADAASRVLSHLASMPEVPEEISEDARIRLAELHLEAGRYKKARRQLAALIAVQPEHAKAHYLMACACEEDETCSEERALRHYRRCARLDPENANYWCELGEFALFLGELEMGLRALRRAAKLAADDPDILNRVAKGLHEAGETAEAGACLRSALFRNAKDARFRDSWARHQLRLLHSQQQEEKLAAQRVKLAASMILPFPAPTPKKTPTSNKQVRHDGPSGLPAPKTPRGTKLPQRKKM
jgi:tetratricopeptide (TPR) repeat protein